MSEETRPSFDALLPREMAARAEEIGAHKARLDDIQLFVLAVLAGAFIGLGAMFSTTVLAGSGSLPYGVARLLGGTVFSLGLILVVVGGAELFTGNTLIVMAWASRRVGTADLLRNWAIVFVGNFAGAVATAVLVFASRQYEGGGGSVGATALVIARAKLALSPDSAFAAGVLCNALVCLAVWLSYSARTTADRVMVIVPPIAAFVAAGFEHSVANMYFVPLALLIKHGAGPEFWVRTGLEATDFATLGWARFLRANLLPVTLGNIVGGAGLVGAVYWFVYLRSASRRERPGH